MAVLNLYHSVMATNLRLRAKAAAALRAAARRSGKSQQEIIRDAVDRHLGLATPTEIVAEDHDPLVASGVIYPPRSPYRTTTPSLVLPEGVSSLDILDRQDRF